MECLTVIFSHVEKEQMLKHYEWHKQMCSKVKVVWDIKDIPPDKFEDPKNPDILPMELDSLWANLHAYYPAVMGWFLQERAEYFILMERDAVIIDKDFEKKIMAYMKEHKVLVAFPWLDSQWTNPQHPFAQRLQGLQAKQWTIPALTVIRADALQYYGQSFMHLPEYWGEIRMPTVLCEAGMQVIANPFIMNRFFYSPDKSVPPEQQSMKLELIEQAIKEGCGALHPIKDYNLLDFIRIKNEEKATKKVSIPQ